MNNKQVTLSDPSLKIEVFATGLKKPTNLAFLESGDALVLEKDNGTVRRISNGSLLPEPLLDVNVATVDTRGLLGIAVAKNETVEKEYIFLYYTEASDGDEDGEDKCYTFSRCIPGYLKGEMLYRYELSNNDSKLINQKLMFAWPPFAAATHNGGEMIMGPDNNLYIIVGDGQYTRSTVTNENKNLTVDGRAGILVFDHNGKSPLKNGIIGSEYPLNHYYAYGIRNGFGLDFDPITGNLWDTENGPVFGDEINLVEPGFNSGWKKVQGMWNVAAHETQGKLIDGKPDNLVTFNGSGVYSSPELAWNQTIAPTAIKFLNSNKYGKQYENDVFVGSNIGYLFHFDLDSKRIKLDLQGPLKDGRANNYADELTSQIFGKNLEIISDVTIGPEGYLYIVSMTRGEIYRIIPPNNHID